VALVQGGVPDEDGEVVPGWPFGRFLAGQPVRGLDAAADENTDVATVFYANIRRAADGRPVTSGGRVLHVVGAGADLDEARSAAYRRAAGITFPGVRYRGDIGVVRPAQPLRSVS
jgi:phosphoribosylamine--glycine ligase